VITVQKVVAFEQQAPVGCGQLTPEHSELFPWKVPPLDRHSACATSLVQVPIGLQHAPRGKQTVLVQFVPLPCAIPPKPEQSAGTRLEQLDGGPSKQQACGGSGHITPAHVLPSP
jgi:hypothetical protein